MSVCLRCTRVFARCLRGVQHQVGCVLLCVLCMRTHVCVLMYACSYLRARMCMRAVLCCVRVTYCIGHHSTCASPPHHWNAHIPYIHPLPHHTRSAQAHTRACVPSSRIACLRTRALRTSSPAQVKGTGRGRKGGQERCRTAPSPLAVLGYLLLWSVSQVSVFVASRRSKKL